MKLARAQSIGAGAGFADALFADLAEQVDKLPLERFCSNGGWPLNVKISTIAILEDRPQIFKVIVYIGFTETGAACCSGDNFEQEHFEELLLEIDKTGWTCDILATV
ncbi:MAG: hypothetical protein GY927_22670 [bacterium]|nr:hypothetical protein [bacterium]